MVAVTPESRQKRETGDRNSHYSTQLSKQSKAFLRAVWTLQPTQHEPVTLSQQRCLSNAASGPYGQCPKGLSLGLGLGLGLGLTTKRIKALALIHALINAGKAQAAYFWRRTALHSFPEQIC